MKTIDIGTVKGLHSAIEIWRKRSYKLREIYKDPTQPAKRRARAAWLGSLHLGKIIRATRMIIEYERAFPNIDWQDRRLGQYTSCR